MRSKVHVSRLLRHLIQAAAFVFFPGLFLSIFGALGDIVSALVNGTFSIAGLGSQLVLLLAVTLFSVLWGRFFCGYLCTFGTAQELVGWISKKLLPDLRAIPSRADRVLKYVKYAALVLCIVFLWVLQLPADSSLSPWGVFGILLSGNLALMSAAVPTLGFAALAAILAGNFFVERFFCRYLCPLGALFALSSGRRLFRIRRREEACCGCGLCSRTCAMGVSIHDRQSVVSGECINCMRCVNVCCPNALHSNPHPAVAGTAAALAICGLAGTGNISAEAVSEPVSLSQSAETDTYVNSLLESVVIPDEGSGRYADGVYTGTGSGFRGEIRIQVTVENGVISDITVLSSKDDKQFFNKALNNVIAEILEKQSPEVDSVSGASFSSKGIMEAVADALDVEYSGGTAVAEGGGRDGDNRDGNSYDRGGYGAGKPDQEINTGRHKKRVSGQKQDKNESGESPRPERGGKNH